jgi:hypothetical protein
MFTIYMPVTFKVGDTANVRINQEPQRLTWRDADTLVIEPGDARKIVDRWTDGELITFVCADADGTADYHVTRA